MKEYKIEKDLTSPILLKTFIMNDERGYLMPLMDSINPELVNRACVVGNFGNGVKRGIHYHKKEWKIYSVVTGAAKFISVKIPENLVDNGNESLIKEYLLHNPDNIKSYIISSRVPGILVIPAWHANGWINLEENTNVIFLSNLSFEEARDDDYRFSSSLISEEWWDQN